MANSKRKYQSLKITQGKVRDLFSYDSTTGILKRNHTVSSSGLKGAVVGCRNSDGYLHVQIENSGYIVHRVCFLHYHGYLPKQIDHINGIKDDNRIINLRGCDRFQNAHNLNIQKNNTSGIKGVFWHKDRRLWSSIIKSKNKTYYLGYFWDKETAAQVVRIKRLELHGEFANHG